MIGEFLDKTRASWARTRYSNPSKATHVVLVAGEYGKSTTALLLASLLEADEKSVAVFTNVESRIDGTPYPSSFDTSAMSLQKAISQAKKKCDYVVVEQTALLKKPYVLDTLDIGSVIAITLDDEIIRRAREFTVLAFENKIDQDAGSSHRVMYVGEDKRADAAIKNIVLRRGGTEAKLIFDYNVSFDIATYLLGTANVFNCAFAASMSYLLGVGTEVMPEGIARVEAVKGNFERTESGKPYITFVDRARTDASVKSVMDSAKKLKKRRLLVAFDDKVSNGVVDDLRGMFDSATTYGRQLDNGAIAECADAATARNVVLRGAKKDDMVMLIGDAFTEVTGEESAEETSA